DLNQPDDVPLVIHGQDLLGHCSFYLPSRIPIMGMCRNLSVGCSGVQVFGYLSPRPDPSISQGRAAVNQSASPLTLEIAQTALDRLLTEKPLESADQRMLEVGDRYVLQRIDSFRDRTAE